MGSTLNYLSLQVLSGTEPTVNSISITSATGIQNDTLNAGDVVYITVNMSQLVNVDTTGGTPQLALSIGGATIQANYDSGTGSTALVFSYTILAGQNDDSGISIVLNPFGLNSPLNLNGGTIKNAGGENAILNYGTVLDNPAYLVDTTAPAAPTALDLAQIDDSGVTTDNLTSQTNNLTISGTAEVAGTVQLFDDADNDGVIDAGELKASGTSAQFATGLDINLSGEGVHNIKAKVTDVAGNESLASTALAITIDSSAPTAPTAITLTPSGGTVVANTMNGTNTAMDFGATIVAGEATGGRAEFYVNGVLIGTDNSIGAGDTTVSYTTSDGSPTAAELQAAIAAGGVVTVKLYDLANNEVTGTGPTLTRDIVAPSAPAGLDLAAADDDGISNSDNSTSRTTGLTISGTADAGTTITLFKDNGNGEIDGGEFLGTAVADGSGEWNLDIDLAYSAAPYHLRAIATDAVGNASTASTALDVSVTPIDATSYSATTITFPTMGSVGSESFMLNGQQYLAVTNSRDDLDFHNEERLVTLKGITKNVAGGSTVTVTFNDGVNNVQVNTIVQADGQWSIAPTDISSLNVGNVTVTATAGGATDTENIYYGTPTGPAVTIITPISGNSIISDAEDNTLVISGIATGVDETLSGVYKYILIIIDDGAGAPEYVGVPVAITGGNWTTGEIDVSGLTDGYYTVTAVLTDASGIPEPSGINDAETVYFGADDVSMPSPSITITGPIALDAIVDNVYTDHLESDIYKWSGSNFELAQSIITYGAFDWESFTYDGEQYLIVANSAAGQETSALDHQIESVIYKWNGVAFEAAGSVLTDSALDWESFNVGGDFYLIASEYFADNGNITVGNSSYDLKSRVFEISKSGGISLTEVNSIDTLGARDADIFVVDNELYIAIANYSDNSNNYNQNSVVLKWDNVFQEFSLVGGAFNTTIATNGAYEVETFVESGQYYLAIANFMGTESKIYRWVDAATGFDVNNPINVITTAAATDFESFVINDQQYIAVANVGGATSYIYKWNSTLESETGAGVGSFDEATAQAINVQGIVDWESFVMDGEQYLSAMIHHNGTTYSNNSLLYRFDTTTGQFVEAKQVSKNFGTDEDTRLTLLMSDLLENENSGPGTDATSIVSVSANAVDSLGNPYGTLVISGSNVIFTPNATADALNKGDIKDLYFTYTNDLGAVSTVNIRLNGMDNDLLDVNAAGGTPVITGAGHRYNLDTTTAQTLQIYPDQLLGDGSAQNEPANSGYQFLQGLGGFNEFTTNTGWTDGTYALGATPNKMQIVVDGDGSDTLELFNTTYNDWLYVGNVSEGANAYSVYNFGVGQAQVIVDNDITISVLG